MRVELSVVSDQPAAARELTDYQYCVFDLIRNGRALCCEMTEEGPRYFLDGGGATVTPATAQAIIGSGRVQPAGDGMFGTTQTYWSALRQALLPGSG